jgi:hypothetical protein
MADPLTEEEKEMYRGLNALRLEVDSSIVESLTKLFTAATVAIRKQEKVSASIQRSAPPGWG